MKRQDWSAGEGLEDLQLGTVAEVAAGVETYLRARSRVSAEDAHFSRQINLWEDGYVDSIGVVELIGYIEDTFAVVLPDEVLFDPGFASVDGIARIVGRLPRRPALRGDSPTPRAAEGDAWGDEPESGRQ